MIREINDPGSGKPQPYLYVLKEHNTLQQKEKFFCRLKGSVYAASQGKFYLICFMHSLRINLAAIPDDTISYSDEGNPA